MVRSPRFSVSKSIGTFTLTFQRRVKVSDYASALRVALAKAQRRVNVSKAGSGADISEVDAIKNAMGASCKTTVVKNAVDINAAGDSMRAAVAAMPGRPTRMPTRAEIELVTQKNARAEESVVGVIRAQRLIRQGKL
jgi:hypothetical protein